MRLLDIARGAYTRSPSSFRRSIAPVVALAPSSLKYGSNYRRWRADIARSHEDPGFSDMRVRESLRLLLAKALASPFHRARIETAFGAISNLDWVGPEDWARLPISDKGTLQPAGNDALAAPASTLDIGETGGSNGDSPFAFFLDRDRSVREIAFINHTWARTGYREKDARAILRGFTLKSASAAPFEWEPALKELRLSVHPLNAAAAASYLDEIDRHRIVFIHGYPSAIEVFCRQILRLGRMPALPVRAIFPISETVQPHQRRLFQKVFAGAEIVPFYGLSERAAFASELPGQPGVYEFEPLYGFTELLDDDGSPVREIGAKGRIVGTGFVSTGMPFIRYDTQDRAELVAPATRENGWRLRVRSINPRRSCEFLVDNKGQLLSTVDLGPEDPEVMRGIREYQLLQEVPGACSVHYVLGENGTSDDAPRFLAYLLDKFAGCMTVEMKQVDSILAGTHGKRPFIIQQLDTSRY